MAITLTTNTNLQKPAAHDRAWDVPLSANADALDAMAAIGNLCVALTEVPSTTLNIKVSNGVFRKSDGTIVSYTGTGSPAAMTTAILNYVYLTDAGVLTVNTTGFPAAYHVRLATVLAGATTITTITDARSPLVSSGANGNTIYLALAGGTFADGSGVVTVGTGTTNGTKLGSGVTDKLGFWGVAPVVQPSGASQAAVGSLATVALTDSTGGAASTTLAAISDTATKNAIASLAAQHANILADLNTLKTLSNAQRSAMVTIGTMKGSA